MCEPSESAALSPTVTRAWICLIRTQRRILSAVERDLKAAGLPPLGWYDVLLELKRASDGRLRAYDIEERTLMAQYNLSRLIDRLEAKNFVRREPVGDDGRGRWVVITEDGRAIQARIWAVYRESLRTNFGRKLDEEALSTLADLLDRLL